MRFTAQQISEIVSILDLYPNFDSEEEELPEVLAFCAAYWGDLSYENLLFDIQKIKTALTEKFPFVWVETDESIPGWIYINITHN